jgi:hypothetical protein
MNNTWETSHACGGLATIIVLAIILALAAVKFAELFRRETILLTSVSEISSFYNKVAMSTSYDSSNYPVMIGVKASKNILLSA